MDGLEDYPNTICWLNLYFRISHFLLLVLFVSCVSGFIWVCLIIFSVDCVDAGLNDLMESKGGKKKSSSSSSKSIFYEAPLGYSIEDVRPNGGIKKFRSAAYSNVYFLSDAVNSCICFVWFNTQSNTVYHVLYAVRSQTFLISIQIDSSLHATIVLLGFFFFVFN